MPRQPSSAHTTEPTLVRAALIALAVVLAGALIGAPIVIILRGALGSGLRPFVAAVTDPDALAALRLSGVVVATAIPVNVVFGLAAGWAIGKFRFPGRGALLALLDLPLAVSPVISGLAFVLLLGAQGVWGSWLAAHGVQVLFAPPGIVLVTVFVTFPYVAREVIPALERVGIASEEAALVGGATGWQTFIRITLPGAQAALVSGIALATARAAGEFGAVSVVSGHIRGRTNTLPLHIDALYGSDDMTGAFAVSTILFALAAVMLLARRWADRR